MWLCEVASPEAVRHTAIPWEVFQFLLIDPVTTDPKGEASRFSRGNTPTLVETNRGQAPERYSPRQDDDIVCATRNCGIKYDVGSSHPGAGEGPKGLAVRQ